MIAELPHAHAAQILERIPPKEDFQVVAEVFKLLDEPNRLQLFWVLCHVEECVINLAAMLGTSSPNLSHHLKLLKDGGLIVSRRDGKEMYYHAADTEQVHMLHKALEQIMQISCPERRHHNCECAEHHREDLSELEQTIQKVHAHLAAHLDERITIEELSRRFLLNSTTLKNGFKEMYGTSIAAHIKEHRLEKAAQLLRETDASVAEIAKMVGYSNQSKFSSAFSERFHHLPLEYRKRHTEI